MPTYGFSTWWWENSASDKEDTHGRNPALGNRKVDDAGISGAMTYRIPIENIEVIAVKNGYSRIAFQENIGMLSYSDGETRINIYLTKMTVATCLKHPKKGATQLFRRNVNEKILNEIFEYPRKHTGKGYYKKK